MLVWPSVKAKILKCLYNPGYSITQISHRPFLSWQTWDLLRVMYYGFKDFCVDFLN